MKLQRILIPAGGLVLLFIIFGVPAILVPMSMENVPERSRIKVLTLHQQIVDTLAMRFAEHSRPDLADGRVAPLPDNSHDWIELVNPMGRKAPGGGLAVLPEANDATGAIGVRGDAGSVVVTLPAFAGLLRQETVVSDSTAPPHAGASSPSEP